MVRPHRTAMQRRTTTMGILAVLGFLTLFSLISYTLGTDDLRQRGYTPTDEVMFWMKLGSR
jgi:hypothetical protein